MENLAGLSAESKRDRRRPVDKFWDKEDDTASNTDFELAMVMKRRWT
jgi:hypothetical protein